MINKFNIRRLKKMVKKTQNSSQKLHIETLKFFNISIAMAKVGFYVPITLILVYSTTCEVKNHRDLKKRNFL